MKRTILYFIFCFAVLIWAFAQGCAGLVIYIALLLVALGVLLEVVRLIFIKYRRSLAVTKLLEAGSVDKFLEEIDRDIAGERSKNYRQMLRVNKSAGLYYKGRGREALALLDQVNVKKLPKAFRRLYYNNRLANLLLEQRIPEAQQLVVDNAPVFQIADKPTMIDQALTGNLAALAFHQGDLARSRQMFETLLTLKGRSRFYMSAAHLYLGSIDLKEGNFDAAKAHLLEAQQAAPGTYIFERATRMLNMLE